MQTSRVILLQFLLVWITTLSFAQSLPGILPESTLPSSQLPGLGQEQPAPSEFYTPLAPTEAALTPEDPASKPFNLFEFDILINPFYSLSGYDSRRKNVIYQYTGYEDFKDISSANSATNLKVSLVKDIYNVYFIKALAIGLEYGYFSQDMNEMLAGKRVSVDTPSMKYSASNVYLSADLYYFNHFYNGNSALKLYFGLGYGYLVGKIERDKGFPDPVFTNHLPSQRDSSYSGIVSYREAGAQILYEYIGVNLALRLNTVGNVYADTDNFDQDKSSDNIQIKQDTISILLGMLVRF